MTTQLPALPSADLTRLTPVAPQDLVLACLAFERAATARAIARRLKPWGVGSAQTSAGLAALAKAGLVEAAGERCIVTDEGEAAAGRCFDLETGASWPEFAERQFTALALGLDPVAVQDRTYLGNARNLYAAALAALFDLADPAAHPKLNAVRAALVWRIVAARCPELLSTEPPGDMSGPGDAVTRAVYIRFCGLTRGTVDQATPALLRRTLPGPVGAGVVGLRRALVRAALKEDTEEIRQPVSDEPEVVPPSEGGSEDFGKTVAALARKLKTPKAKGGHFTGGQVAIAQLYDAYAAGDRAPLTLDDFKSRLWTAVRDGADFHLTRLDIPDLMDDDLRKRSATPTRAGDVVHFVVLD
ncbi:MAG: hypothetical protein ACLFPA_00690 [Dichotomicrobium sp.]